MARVQQLKKEINVLLVREENMWKKRSRALWLHEGDQNTLFFHSRATHRYRRNKITEIENSVGELCSSEESISAVLIGFYQNLFTSLEPSQIELAMDPIPETVSAEMNAALSKEFTRTEDKVVHKQMESLKAPGPDGLPPLFF